MELLKGIDVANAINLKLEEKKIDKAGNGRST